MGQRQSAVRGRFRWMARAHLWLALPVLALVALCVTGGRNAEAASAERSLPGQATLSILNPVGLAGPAGTNVTAKITDSTKGHVFNLAYAPVSPGCSAMGASSTPLPQVTVGGGGSVQFSFAWPAESGTGSFVLCAVDQKDVLPAPVQSQQTFSVLSTSVPAISIQPAPQPTPTGTASSSDTPTDENGYTTGESVIVQGTGFLPGGTSVVIALAGQPDEAGNQISQSPVNTDTSGNFSTTVTLPQFRIGSLYIQAMTTDGGNNQPPSLLASTPISIVPAPSPTATPSPTVTATVAASPTPQGGDNGSGNGGTLRILGIAGLGSFSVLLLLVGTALLISAGRMNDGVG